MKFQIISNLEPLNLLNRVPRAYRDLISIRQINEPVDLLVFPYDCKAVICSKDILKISDKLASAENKMVGIGGCFTIEALNLLKNYNVEIFALSDFPLTDRSHQALINSRTLGLGRFGYRFIS